VRELDHENTKSRETYDEGTTRSRAAMEGGRECLWTWGRMMRRTVEAPLTPSPEGAGTSQVGERCGADNLAYRN